ncbi:MAG: enoyl-CoA hydratase-related protein [Hyphomonadaceae bacterium]
MTDEQDMLEFEDGRLIVRFEPPFGWLVFNRPKMMNAVNRGMWNAIPQAMAALNARKDVRIVIARGAGDAAFVSGADISEFETERANSDLNRGFTAAVTAATASLLESPKPVIAMIRGYCIGGGVVIASACDIRICADDAQFGVPPANLGLGYELDNYTRLTQLVGPAAAKYMALSARRIDAEDARRIGLVSLVTAPDALEDETLKLAREIAGKAPLTLAAVKASHLHASGLLPRETAQAAIDTCFDSKDFAAGRESFMTKQKPVFTGE